MADDHARRRLPVMVRQTRKSHKLSWPCIDSSGLYRRKIVADGNCLFRALSDQLYNTTKRHEEIRHRVVQYLRSNKDRFEPFVMANVEESLIRSQPTTRLSRSRTASVDHDPFEVYLENMAKASTWGGDIEITAFCEVFDRDVLIHRPTDVDHPFTPISNSKRAAGQSRQLLHISFGNEVSFAHYESVRPRKAPLAASPPPPKNMPSTSTRSRCHATATPQTLPEDHHNPFIQDQEPHPDLSREDVRHFLKEPRTDFHPMFQSIIDRDWERGSSVSSTSENSSFSKRFREDDEEDEDSPHPPKRTLRHVSLRSKTRAATTSTVLASSPKGTEISMPIRVGTLSATPIQARKAGEGGRGSRWD